MSARPPSATESDYEDVRLLEHNQRFQQAVLHNMEVQAATFKTKIGTCRFIN
jgi:hypothetical protein